MLARYFTFEGRATRYQFWMFTLVYAGAIVVASFLDTLLIGRSDFSDPSRINPASLVPFFTLITMLAFLVPSICLCVRRLHDRDRSGWFYLLLFLPIIGLWPFVEIGFLRGTYGPNRFGPDPLGGAALGYGYPPQPYPGQYGAQPAYYPPQEGAPPGYPPQPHPPSYDPGQAPSSPPQYPPQQSR